MKKLIFVLLVFLIATSCNKKKVGVDDNLNVFVAASLTDVIKEINGLFLQKNDIELKLNAASSGTLARQIESGAACDVYISANLDWMNYLQKMQLVSEEERADFLYNQLVIIKPKSLQKEIEISFSDSTIPLFEGRISIGDPTHVPAGKYAVDAFKNLGWYEEIKHRLAPGLDVRSALMLVELNETELGVVYLTDALRSDKVEILDTIPEKFYNSITYSVATSSENTISKKYFEFIRSEEVKNIWLKYGFKLK